MAFMMACGSGISSSALSSGSSSGNNTGQGGGTPNATPTTPAPSWTDISTALNGADSGGNYDGTMMIKVDATNQAIDLILPIPSIGGATITPIGAVPVSGLQNVTFGPTTLADGSEAWQISVPLKLLLSGASFPSQFNALPNGNPLPYFPAEEVRGLAVSIPGRSGFVVNLYLGIKAVAVFVGIPGLNMPLGFGASVVNSTKTRNIGYFALIPSVGTSPAGVYLAAQVPNDVALELNSLLGP
jgi:hypothetical protein